MASDTSLIFNIIARDKASAVFAKVRAKGESTGKALALAFAPAAGPLAAGAMGGILSVGTALVGAGAAAAVFGGVMSSTFKEVSEASTKTDDLRDKIRLLGEQARIAPTDDMRGKYLKEQQKAAIELQARLNLLPAPVRAATVAYGGMKDAWKGFVDQNKPATYGIMTSGFNLLTAAIPKLQPLFDVAANAANGLLQKLHGFVSGGGFDRFIAWLATAGKAALSNFMTIGENLFVTIGKIFGAFDANGPNLLTWLTQASTKMREWAEGGGAKQLVDYFQSQGPGTGKILLDIATAFGHIAQAVTPLAPLSMALAGALARIVAAVPPGVITGLVAAYVAFNIALKAYAVYTVAAGIATKGWAAAQWLLRGAMVAINFVAATAQIVGYLAKVVAVRIATYATAAAQAVWNGAMVAANFVRATAQIALFAAKQAAIAVATKAWAAAQWLLNVAMSANPVTLIIIAIVALIAVFVLLWTKSAAFRNFWISVWGVIRSAAVGAWNWIKSTALTVFNWFMSIARRYITIYSAAWNLIKTVAVNAWNSVRSKAVSFFSWIMSMPGKVSSKLGSMFNGLWTGFKSIVNKLIGGWNRLQFTIGGGSFAGISIPSASFGTPNIPFLAKGGDVQRSGMAMVGERGPELVSLSRGAQVTPLRKGAGSRTRLQLDVRGEREIVALLRKLIRTADLLEA